MLLILRAIIVIIYSILICIFGCIWCLFSPRDPRHVATFGRLFGKLSTVFGLKVELRRPEGACDLHRQPPEQLRHGHCG
jgi:1-acyl-sn-glycerol-3-phosphate acyltransferase